MPADDAAELRALQAKAYGRDGGLTAPEARRLEELEGARNASMVPVAREEPIEQEASASPTVESAPPESDDDTPAPRAAERQPTAAPGVRGLLREHAKTVIAASFVLLLIGVAAGWAVFGRDAGSSSLTAGQQERKVELQTEGEYDDGSVRLVSEDDEAVVWYATRRDGELACVVLDVGDASQQQCGRVETIDTMGLSVSVSVPVADPEDPADEYGTTFSAVIGHTTAGEPLAWIQRWTHDDSMLDQFEGDERDRAEELLSEGYLSVPTVVGYFHDEPVWLAERPADGTQSGGLVRCMVVDALSEASACQTADDGPGGLRAVSVETGDDGTPVMWTLHIRFTNWQSPYLTIEQGEPTDVGVTFVELGGEHGDPILVEVPTSESGG